MNTYKYSIIRITPNPIRAETINIGFVVIKPSGPDVRVVGSFTKIKAITNSFSIDNLDNLREQLEILLTERLSLEQAVGFFQGSIVLSSVGTFNASDDAEYELKINEINKLYITPERSKKKTEVTQKRIITELKDEFERIGIMGKDIEDIHNHKVVQGYPLSEPEGLYAELLLKNGIYHLTETLDFRILSMKQKMGESAVKAITMNTARFLWSENVKTFVVYAAHAEQEHTHARQINLVNGYADNMYNILSHDDMAKYFDHMMNAAGCSMRLN
ncbi:hypothetical protein PEC311524_19610 [Pectobacterium carotovorum subsp. carotovorum]|nr:hypothetical protein PEC311524_19610 [Pectobacterium carotovorum subsp. carotovorum]